MNIKDLIKDNTVSFSYLRKNVAFYDISYLGINYMFPVPLDDIGDASLLSTDKAIIFMRYIRAAIENNQLIVKRLSNF